MRSVSFSWSGLRAGRAACPAHQRVAQQALPDLQQQRRVDRLLLLLPALHGLHRRAQQARGRRVRRAAKQRRGEAIRRLRAERGVCVRGVPAGQALHPVRPRGGERRARRVDPLPGKPPRRLLRRRGAKAHDRAARAHRRQQTRLAAGKDQQRIPGRLLQRFEQRVLAARRSCGAPPAAHRPRRPCANGCAARLSASSRMRSTAYGAASS